MDIHFKLLYRPPPNKKNQFSNTLSLGEFPDLLDSCNLKKGKHIILSDFNFHFDQPSADKVPYDFEQSVTESTHKSGHILDWILFWKSDDLVKTTTVSHDLTSDHNAVLSDLNVSKLYCPPVTTVHRNIRGIDRVALGSDITRAISLHPDLSVADYNTELQALLDTHAPATTCKI